MREASAKLRLSEEREEEQHGGNSDDRVQVRHSRLEDALRAPLGGLHELVSILGSGGLAVGPRRLRRAD